jgi:predicted phosphodiesterase
MRVFALSDIHVDYPVNAQWVENLSVFDYQDDLLIVAGDVSDSLKRIEQCLKALTRRFSRVLFVPGNHELWVMRDPGVATSLIKFTNVCTVAEQAGASMQAFHRSSLWIVPLLGWYDFSFGLPGEYLRSAWMDFIACRWPAGWKAGEIATYFLGLNDCTRAPAGGTTISFSHFLPRIDLMPAFIPAKHRTLYPVLGSARLDEQIRALGSTLHVYGHSHVNWRITIDGVTYVNNAFAYPHENHLSSRSLLCLLEQ